MRPFMVEEGLLWLQGSSGWAESWLSAEFCERANFCPLDSSPHTPFCCFISSIHTMVKPAQNRDGTQSDIK